VVRLFRWIAIAAWAIGIGCSFLGEWVERSALRQPSEPVGEYSVPMRLKGVIRYVTPDQQFYNTLAQIGFPGGLVAFLLFGSASEWLRRRQKGPLPNSKGASGG
jgi:hypothetical protein